MCFATHDTGQTTNITHFLYIFSFVCSTLFLRVLLLTMESSRKPQKLNRWVTKCISLFAYLVRGAGATAPDKFTTIFQHESIRYQISCIFRPGTKCTGIEHFSYIFLYIFYTSFAQMYRVELLWYKLYRIELWLKNVPEIASTSWPGLSLAGADCANCWFM